MSFPATRMRRLRRSAGIRDMLAETRLNPSRMVYPVFVDGRSRRKREITLMPGQFTYPLGSLGKLAGELEDKGIPSVLLFGVPRTKDASGSGAFSSDGVVQRAIGEIREGSSLTVAADLCLCEYTSNGQCGITRGGDVDNDATLGIYAKIAVSQAEAGAHIIAPSGMMDGQVGAIRKALDGSGHSETMVMAYASKSASSFYGPFREAAESAPAGGDRKGYQLNFANARESMRELQLDAEEGADILMVKPAMPNLDIICRARERFDLPLAAYSVSGEYSMLKAASKLGMIDYRSAVIEAATSIFRSGADILITYSAPELAGWIE